MEESPMQFLIDKMYLRLNDPEVKTSKLSEIIQICYECREGLLEPGGHPDNRWWADQGLRDFTEIIVRANFKAHQILNPTIVIDDLDEQLKQALDEINEKILNYEK